MYRYFLLFLFLFALAPAQAQPQIDWVRHIASKDSSSSLQLSIIDATVDINGHLIVTGSFSEDIDLDSDGTYDLTVTDITDLFVAQFAHDGALNWARVLGSNNTGSGLALTTDQAGNIYVSGIANYLTDLDNDGLSDLTEMDTFLLKYNSNGVLQWTQSYESPIWYPVNLVYNEQRNEIIAAGNDVIPCQEYPQPPECYVFKLLGQINIASYTPEGQLIWSQTGNNPPSDSTSYMDIQQMRLAQNGQIQIAGIVNGTVDFQTNDHLPILSDGPALLGQGRLYWATLSKEGDLVDQQVSDYVLSTRADIEVISSGTLYVSDSRLLDLSSPGLPSHQGEILQLDNNGSLNWTHTFQSVDSTSFFANAWSINVDTNNYLYMSGTLTGVGDLDSDGVSDISHAPGAGHAFFARYLPSGSLDWVHTVDLQPFTNSSSHGQMVVTRNGRSLYAIGSFQGTIDFDGSAAMPPRSSVGFSDMFIMHITSPTTTTAVDHSDFTNTSTLSAPYPNPFVNHTSFTLQVARTQHVRISLYNLLGQRVATIYEGLVHQHEPHHITFDVGDAPSGLYVVQAIGEHFQQTQNILKIR